MAILGCFAIGALVLANVGVQVYKNIVTSNSENFKLRTSLSYIATKVRQCDERGCVYITKEQGTPMLILEERGEGIDCITRIYFYKGELKELYQEKGMEYQLKDGLAVTELKEFDILQLPNNRISMTAKNKQGEKENLVISLRVN